MSLPVGFDFRGIGQRVGALHATWRGSFAIQLDESQKIVQHSVHVPRISVPLPRVDQHHRGLRALRRRSARSSPRGLGVFSIIAWAVMFGKRNELNTSAPAEPRPSSGTCATRSIVLDLPESLRERRDIPYADLFSDAVEAYWRAAAIGKEKGMDTSRFRLEHAENALQRAPRPPDAPLRVEHDLPRAHRLRARRSSACSARSGASWTRSAPSRSSRRRASRPSPPASRPRC